MKTCAGIGITSLRRLLHSEWLLRWKQLRLRSGEAFGVRQSPGALLLTGLATAALTLSAFGAESVDALLQKGLFEEEANQNFPEAIKAYEAVIEQTDEQRKLAATAIFRLGECYRKLGRTNEANAQYQRVLRDFVDQAHLVKLSRELLGPAAGSSTNRAFEDRLRTIVGAAAPDPEEEKIRKLEGMFRDNPDLVNAPTDTNLRTLLHEAAVNGQLRVVDYLLTQGANVEVRDNSGFTPLLVATQAGRKEVVERLLRAKANPNTADRKGATPAHYATQQAMKAMLELLIRAGADVNAKGDLGGGSPGTVGGSTPLHIAAGQGYQAVAEFLIDSKADVNARNRYSQTPLHIAAKAGHDPLAELLLGNGADVNARDANGQTPLHAGVARPSTANLLLRHGADINARDSSGATPLFVAVKENRAELVDLLIKNKADVNVATAQQQTPLFQALEGRAADIAEMLLNAGADVNARHGQGYSVIHSAANSGNIPLLRAILKSKPNLEVRNSGGYTPLLQAVANGGTEIVALLLEAGADPNGLYLREGTTPLHFAASKGFTEIAALLLEHKADPNIVSANGQTAFDYAKASSSRLSPVPGVYVNPPPQPLLTPGVPSRTIQQQGTHMATAGVVTQWVQLKSQEERARQQRAGFPQVTSEPGDIRDLLINHGADTNIARRGAIALQRNDYQSRWFTKGDNPHNRFTLFELLASFYDPASQMASYLAFPDLSRIKIHRLKTNGPTEELQFNVAALLHEGDCSKDVWLQWGDVVTVPEEEHPYHGSWQGFDVEQVDTLTNCLRRQVFVKIKGNTNELTLGPHRTLNPRYRGAANAQFWLSKVLFASKLLLSTSDLSRIKVYRTDPITREKLELTFDVSNSPPPSDLWLRDGDLIEVPERPSGTASAERSEK